MDLKNRNFEDVDIRYIDIMYFGDMKNLIELSLELDKNKIGNKGLLNIMLIIDELDNLINLNLSVKNSGIENNDFGDGKNEDKRYREIVYVFLSLLNDLEKWSNWDFLEVSL